MERIIVEGRDRNGKPYLAVKDLYPGDLLRTVGSANGRLRGLNVSSLDYALDLACKRIGDRIERKLFHNK